MKKINIKGRIVEIYDTIEDLPIKRFHKYNKLLLIDSGIGTDLADVDRHISRAQLFIKKNDVESAVTEMENLRQNIYFVQSEISPRFMAFAVLVKSVDGQQFDDISDDGLKKIVENVFGDMSKKDLTASFEEVKKKIDEELQLYFPKVFDDSTLKEYYDKLRRRTILVLQGISAGGISPNSRELIDEITDELITFFNPQNFGGAENAEITYDKRFENMCLLLSQRLHVDSKKYSVLEFYNAFEYVKKEAKEMQKAKRAK